MKQEFNGLPALEQRFVLAEFPVTFVEPGKKGVRCIVEIKRLLTPIAEGVQQTDGRVAQVGTGKAPKRCFDLLSCVCVHGYICVFSSVSCSALFLRRLQ